MGKTWAAECRAEALRFSRTGLRISAPPNSRESTPGSSEPRSARESPVIRKRSLENLVLPLPFPSPL